MCVVDTNVLVSAADQSVPEHARCRALIEQCRRRHGAWFLTWAIAYEFLRVVTHPQVLRQPWTMEADTDFIAALRESSGLAFLTPTDRHAHVLAENVVERCRIVVEATVRRTVGHFRCRRKRDVEPRDPEPVRVLCQAQQRFRLLNAGGRFERVRDESHERLIVERLH